jgi:tripartite-type tricarboxylate transporter receptor subunit TctC
MWKLAFTLAAAVGLLTPAIADTFPTKPVRLIVPFQPGGSDQLYRALSAELSTKWKQPVIVENKPGADSLIGAEFVARSPADGYTLLATVDTTTVINRFLYKKLPYDPDKSFAPISLLAQTDFFIVANPKFPASNLRELIAYVKANPGKVSFGSFARGSQAELMIHAINKRERTDILTVPYKGVSLSLGAAIAGDVQLASGGYGVVGQHIKAGKLKPLAMAGRARDSFFPEVSTTAEQGAPYVLASIWYGLYAPAGTPEAVVRQISQDVRAVLQDREFAQKHMLANGLTPVASTPRELAERIAADVKLTAELVEAAGIKPE